jgi:hypothetical protein
MSSRGAAAAARGVPPLNTHLESSVSSYSPYQQWSSGATTQASPLGGETSVPTLVSRGIATQCQSDLLTAASILEQQASSLRWLASQQSPDLNQRRQTVAIPLQSNNSATASASQSAFTYTAYDDLALLLGSRTPEPFQGAASLPPGFGVGSNTLSQPFPPRAQQVPNRGPFGRDPPQQTQESIAWLEPTLDGWWLSDQSRPGPPI